MGDLRLAGRASRGDRQRSARRKEIVRRYFEGRFNDRNTEVVDQYLDPSADPEGQKAWLAGFYATFADTQSASRTSSPRMMWVRPNGKRVTFPGMAW